MDDNKQIPEAIKEFAKSVEIYDVCEQIGQSHNLQIDQIGELDSEIRGVLVGKNKSSDFTDHVIKRLEIDRGLAEQITNEINEKVFTVMREKIHGGETLNKTATTLNKNSQNNLVGYAPEVANNNLKPTHVSELEKAGGFTIEELGHPINKHEMMVVDRRSEPDQVEQAKNAPPPKALAYNPPQINPRYQEVPPTTTPAYVKPPVERPAYTPYTPAPVPMSIPRHLTDSFPSKSSLSEEMMMAKTTKEKVPEPEQEIKPIERTVVEPPPNLPTEENVDTPQEAALKNETEQQAPVEKNLLAIKEDFEEKTGTEAVSTEASLRQDNNSQPSSRIEIDQSTMPPTFIPAMRPSSDNIKEELVNTPSTDAVKKEPEPVKQVSNDPYRESIE